MLCTTLNAQVTIIRTLTLALDALPDGGVTTLQVNEKLRLALFRQGDRVAAIDDRCPHAGASLAQGTFDGTTVKCPLHGFRVDVWRGIGNAGKRISCFPATIVAGEIKISLAD
jgi:nitrite reductase/ring-hydroxylating ferredoxin subunit